MLSYTGKNITRLLPFALLLVLRTRNNTDGNKLVIFSGIASYYGDNYIVSYMYNSCVIACLTATVHAQYMHTVGPVLIARICELQVFLKFANL